MFFKIKFTVLMFVLTHTKYAIPQKYIALYESGMSGMVLSHYYICNMYIFNIKLEITHTH